MKLRVIAPNLYRDGRRCSIGETFDIDGDDIPLIYRGKVEQVEQTIHVATPNARSNDVGNTSPEVDDQRRKWLMDQIEELTGKRPGGNTKLETLEERFEKAKLEE